MRRLCTKSSSLEIKWVFLEFAQILTQQYAAYFPDWLFGAEQCARWFPQTLQADFLHESCGTRNFAGDRQLEVSDVTDDDGQRSELFGMYTLQFGAQLVRSCIFADVKIHMTDDTDDAEMRNVKLSIITAAMIFFFDVWCCF